MSRLQLSEAGEGTPQEAPGMPEALPAAGLAATPLPWDLRGQPQGHPLPGIGMGGRASFLTRPLNCGLLQTTVWWRGTDLHRGTGSRQARTEPVSPVPPRPVEPEGFEMGRGEQEEWRSGHRRGPGSGSLEGRRCCALDPSGPRSQRHGIISHQLVGLSQGSKPQQGHFSSTHHPPASLLIGGLMGLSGVQRPAIRLQ